jgi:hypothetical protein
MTFQAKLPFKAFSKNDELTLVLSNRRVIKLTKNDIETGNKNLQ